MKAGDTLMWKYASCILQLSLYLSTWERLFLGARGEVEGHGVAARAAVPVATVARVIVVEVVTQDVVRALLLSPLNLALT